MKPILYFLIALFFSPAVMAQVKLAPEAGVNIFNQFSEVRDPVAQQTEISASDFLPGFRAGLNADIGILRSFSIQVGAFYAMHRTGDIFKTTFPDGASTAVTRRVMIHNLQVPLYFLYESGATGSGRFFVGAGPYFLYALGGNLKSEVSKTDSSGFKQVTISKVDMETGDQETDYIKPFDMGIGATLGYEFPAGLYLRTHLQYGLLNLQPQGGPNHSLKNISLGLSLGFYINSGFGRY